MCTPRRELGERGRRDRLLAEADGPGDGSKTEAREWSSGGAVDEVGEGDGELSDTGRR